MKSDGVGLTVRLILSRLLSLSLAARLNWVGHGKKAGLKHFPNIVLALQCTYMFVLNITCIIYTF